MGLDCSLFVAEAGLLTILGPSSHAPHPYVQPPGFYFPPSARKFTKENSTAQTATTRSTPTATLQLPTTFTGSARERRAARAPPQRIRGQTKRQPPCSPRHAFHTPEHKPLSCFQPSPPTHAAGAVCRLAGARTGRLRETQAKEYRGQDWQGGRRGRGIERRRPPASPMGWSVGGRARAHVFTQRHHRSPLPTASLCITIQLETICLRRRTATDCNPQCPGAAGG